MTQDVLKRPTGGAHLHDPDGRIIGVAPVSAPPVPAVQPEAGELTPDERQPPPAEPMLSPSVFQAFTEIASRPAGPCPDSGSGVLPSEPVELPPDPQPDPQPDPDPESSPEPEPVATPSLPATQPPRFDPDSTVVIGRHRSDGTWDTRPVARRRFLGRVSAATVGLFRRGGRR